MGLVTFCTFVSDLSLNGTGVISNVLEIKLHHLNSLKDKEVNEIQIQHGEAFCGLCMKKCYRGIPVGLNLFTVIIFSPSEDNRSEAYILNAPIHQYPICLG